MPMFDYLGQHPEQASQFSQAMLGVHGTEPPTVAAAYDFSTAKTLVDVGGATGNMLAAILSRHPGPRGIVPGDYTLRMRPILEGRLQQAGIRLAAYLDWIFAGA